MMEGVLTSPIADNQIRRIEIFKKKFGSPDFKEVLRKRCRDKIKANRGALFDASRLISKTEVLSIMEEITIESTEENVLSKSQSENSFCEPMEVSALPIRERTEADVGFEEEEEEEEGLEKEYIDDLTEKYCSSMYSRIMAAEVELFDSLLDNTIICPICQKGAFESIGPGLLGCSLCSAQLPWSDSPTRLSDALNSVVSEHSALCRNTPSFSIVSYEGSTVDLFMNCSLCSYLAQIS